MITPDKLRAARSWLNFSREELSERSGVSSPAIRDYEAAKVTPRADTLAALETVFRSQGVEFTPDGIRERKDDLIVIEGDDCYLQLLDDVFYTLKDYEGDKELLIVCADDSVSSPSVNESYRRIRGIGIEMRQLIEEGNTYMLGALREYRYIPKEYFSNHVTVIYGDKVAFVFDNESKISIWRDANQAATQKNLFNFIWKLASQPTHRSNDESF